jgi:hypothetical protein
MPLFEPGSMSYAKKSSCSCASGRRRLGFRAATRTAPAGATSTFEPPQKLRSIDELPCSLSFIYLCVWIFRILFRFLSSVRRCFRNILQLVLTVYSVYVTHFASNKLSVTFLYCFNLSVWVEFVQCPYGCLASFQVQSSDRQPRPQS